MKQFIYLSCSHTPSRSWDSHDSGWLTPTALSYRARRRQRITVVGTLRAWSLRALHSASAGLTLMDTVALDLAVMLCMSRARPSRNGPHVLQVALIASQTGGLGVRTSRGSAHAELRAPPAHCHID